MVRKRAASAVRTAMLATVLVTVLVVGLSGGPAQAREPAIRDAPVFPVGFADPTVARYAHGYVAVSTGALAPRATSASPGGPWRLVLPALPALPPWARPGPIWASDLVRTGRGWLLYYSAVVHRDRRCIGVAAARHALDPFVPVGNQPLVCPRRGAIDPSGFTSRQGRPHLLYKTQGLPTTIRVVRLTGDGRHLAHGAGGQVLLRSQSTIVENPVLLRRGPHNVLLTSEGSFQDCGYRTTWRRSRTLRDWTLPKVLLDHRTSRLCGPGGADVSLGRHGWIVFFHGWTCDLGRPCPQGFDVGSADHQQARRALYAAHLHWHRAAPGIGRFVRPIL